jgi:hypothetical protein
VNMRHIILAGITAVALGNVAPARACACTPKALTYRTAMKSDLRALAALQENSLREHGRFASDLATLGYQPTTGVTVELIEGDERGWVARARHEKLTGTCMVGRGPSAPVRASVDQHGIACDPLGGDPYGVTAAALVTTASLAGIAAATLISIVWLRRRRVPWWPALALLALILLHPAWTVLPQVARGIPPDTTCGAQTESVAIFFAALGGIVLFVQWFLAGSRNGRLTRA